jgi:hypothetical protein
MQVHVIYMRQGLRKSLVMDLPEKVESCGCTLWDLNQLVVIPRARLGGFDLKRGCAPRA